MVVGETAGNVTAEAVHDHPRQTLSLTHRTIFVRKQQALETHDFLSQLGDLT